MGAFINIFVNNPYKLLGNDILYCPLIFIAFAVVEFYTSLVLTNYLFDVGYRIWHQTIRPAADGYGFVIPAPVQPVFIIVAVGLHAQLRCDDLSF